jgi:hypothetical protein
MRVPAGGSVVFVVIVTYDVLPFAGSLKLPV